MTATQTGPWQRVHTAPPAGTRVRVLQPDATGHLHVTIIGEFRELGTMLAGPHDGRRVLDIIPDPHAPELGEHARQEARDWHTHVASGAGTTRYWAWIPGTIIQVRGEVA